MLFPLLSEGGYYIIEDWAWSHHPAYQGAGHDWAHRPALTNLLFEQLMLMASTLKIFEICIRKPMYVIRKFENAPRQPVDWSVIRTRGKEFVRL